MGRSCVGPTTNHDFLSQINERERERGGGRDHRRWVKHDARVCGAKIPTRELRVLGASQRRSKAACCCSSQLPLPPSSSSPAGATCGLGTVRISRGLTSKTQRTWERVVVVVVANECKRGGLQRQGRLRRGHRREQTAALLPWAAFCVAADTTCAVPLCVRPRSL